MLRRRAAVEAGRPIPDHSPWMASRLVGRRAYRVGEPFRSGRTRWPDEACYGIDRDGYVLTLFRPGVTEPMREAVRREAADFALVLESPLAVLAYRFGTALPWEAVPYAWPLTAGEVRSRYLPPARVEPGTRALLWVSLVDSETGLIEAQRGIALAPEFTLALNRAIRQQARLPFDGDAYVRAVASLHHDLPDPARLASRAAARTSSLD